MLHVPVECIHRLTLYVRWIPCKSPVGYPNLEIVRWLPTVTPQGRLEVVQALLQAGADINAKDDFGKTAQEWAEERGG
jgi:ankyrin repeat protein